MAEKFTTWDVAHHLVSDIDAAAYLDACIMGDPGDGSLVRAALNDIARARGMSQLARAAGISREGLYKALSSNGYPEVATVLKVARTLGVRLQASPTA